MAAPSAKAREILADAEKFEARRDVEKAAKACRDAAVLLRSAQDLKQAELAEARADYFEAEAHGARQEFDPAITKCKQAIGAFQQAADNLYAAMSEALLAELEASKVLRLDRFGAAQRYVDDGKRALEKIRLSYPDKEASLRAGIFGLEQDMAMAKFYEAAERMEVDAATNAIRAAMLANAQKSLIFRNLNTVDALANEVEGQILKAREALFLGGNSLDMWEGTEATTRFKVASQSLSEAESKISGQQSNGLPISMEVQRVFIQGMRNHADGLVELARATEDCVTGRYAESNKKFDVAKSLFTRADNILTEGGWPVLARWASVARRSAAISDARARAIKLSRKRFIIGAGKQAGLFTLLMLASLSFVSLLITPISADLLVESSVVVGLVFGFGLDAVRFKDILPWSGKTKEPQKPNPESPGGSNG